jgi:hypothetical protein
MAAAFFTTEYPKLAAINSLTWAANKFLLFTGAGDVAAGDITAAGLALLDDADAAAQRVTLGALGSSGGQKISVAGSLTDPGFGLSILSNANVNVGTVSDGGNPSIRADAYGGGIPSLRIYRATGTQASPADITTNDVFGDVSGYGWRDGGFVQLSRIRSTFTSASPSSTNRAVSVGISGCRDGSASLATFMNITYLQTTFSGSLAPMTDNANTNGSASFRWSVVYAGTGTINTSDERVKRDFSAISDNLLDAWAGVEWVQYRFSDAYETKGDQARWHMGLVAQHVRDAIDNQMGEGSAVRLGLVCYDQWDAQDEVTQPVIAERDVKVGRGKKAKFVTESYDTGEVEVIQAAREAGDRWGLRYEECFAVEAAYQRRRMDRIEARMAG